MRDPYTIYAEYILGLKKLDDLEEDLTHAQRGQIIHEIFHEFIQLYRENLPDQAEQKLLGLAREKLGPLMDNESVRSFWWPRIENIAQGFINTERALRNKRRTVETEHQGKYEIPNFTLTGQTDRIDQTTEKDLVIVDYKTGASPSWPDVEAGFSPQLPLEALLSGTPVEKILELEYWEARGGAVPVKIKPMSAKKSKKPVHDIIRDAAEGLQKIIAAYQKPGQVFPAQPWPQKALKYNDYAQLARIKEWSVVEDDEAAA
jgi:ATP-dependent helicase/nuclease subunit B